jgi:hypothetical protein
LIVWPVPICSRSVIQRIAFRGERQRVSLVMRDVAKQVPFWSCAPVRTNSMKAGRPVRGRNGESQKGVSGLLRTVEGRRPRHSYCHAKSHFRYAPRAGWISGQLTYNPVFQALLTQVRLLSGRITSRLPTRRELASSVNPSRHEGSNGVECGGGVRCVQPALRTPALRTLVGLRLLRYDGSLRKAACGTQL